MGYLNFLKSITDKNITLKLNHVPTDSASQVVFGVAYVVTSILIFKLSRSQGP